MLRSTSPGPFESSKLKILKPLGRQCRRPPSIHTLDFTRHFQHKPTQISPFLRPLFRFPATKLGFTRFFPPLPFSMDFSGSLPCHWTCSFGHISLLASPPGARRRRCCSSSQRDTSSFLGARRPFLLYRFLALL